jgi:hypothetical protein
VLYNRLLTVLTTYLSNGNPQNEVSCAKIYVVGASDGVKLGRQGGVKGASKGGRRGGTGWQRGVTGGITFEDGEWQPKCGGRQFMCDRCQCDMLASIWGH